ncbi:MAG TPA: TIR domain-containing protein [Pyrinomonadaceae bacterium]|jgi:hypothetical protein
MPYLKTYNLFISHSWSYNSDYIRLVSLLKNASNFKWRNYSVPLDDPLAGGSDKKLAEEINNQIRLTNAVLIISGMYVSYRKWIQFEIDLADSFNKPIIGIQPWGSTKTPSAVERSAVDVVGWNTNSIVDAIRKHAI